MSLSSDLDNLLINFDRKVLVTNLLDEYGGLLEETAKTVQEFLAAEEKKGKEFEKFYLLRGRELESENEVITLVPDGKLDERKQQLRNAKSMLYSAKAVGGTEEPPTKFVPLREKATKLQSLKVKEVPLKIVANGTSTATKEPETVSKKPTSALGTMFKKQETTAAAKTTAEVITPKKPEPVEKKPEKAGALGAMFKKQEAAATSTSKKSPKSEAEKKPPPTNTLGAMFKKQEANKKTSPEAKDKPDSKPKRGLSNFLTKKEDEPKTPAPKKEEQPKIKEEPPSANVSVNLFEESESSDDEEALDALKREILTDDEDKEPSSSNKRRRVIESDDEDAGPEVKIEKKDHGVDMDEDEVEPEEPKKSETFLDDEGFIVTKKAKKTAPPRKPNPTPVKLKTPTKAKKESPKSPTPSKKKGAAGPSSKTTAGGGKTKQGNIMNFFTKK